MNCKFCNQHFKATKKKKSFCSYQCYWDSMKEHNETICEKCGKKFKSWKSEQRKFCSRDCKDKTFIGKNHPNWKNGFIDSQGYRIICVNGIRHFEHRYLVEQHLKRKLDKEHIHHINGIKDDNRLENLYMFSNNSSHIKYHSIYNNFKLISNLI